MKSNLLFNLSDYFDEYIEYFIDHIDENLLKSIADKHGIGERNQMAFISLFEYAIIEDNKLDYQHNKEVIGWIKDSLYSDSLYNRNKDWFSQF